MSSTVLSVIVSMAAMILPTLGITVESKALETTIQTILVLATGLWVWYRHVADSGGKLTVFGGTRH